MAEALEKKIEPTFQIPLPMYGQPGKIIEYIYDLCNFLYGYYSPNFKKCKVFNNINL